MNALHTARDSLRRFVYVETYGCQMNVYDTERIFESLRRASYEPTDDPHLADLVLVNSCSVRDKAEHKLMSALGSYRRLKEHNPDLVLGAAGCVAQQEGEALLRKLPYLDLVFGPDHVGELPALVESVRVQRRRIAETRFVGRGDYTFVRPEPPQDGRVTSFITVMKGCNKFCSFCIVPQTRGREVSKPSTAIVEEVRRFVGAGVREVTLLGQNVNSYGKDRAGEVRFHALLEAVDAVPGLERLRFTTSHPIDCPDALCDTFGRLRTLCEYFHLPVQSGSDRVLRMMRRSYTRAHYLDRIARLRAACPTIAISTDIIVGFPGESDADFEETMSILEEVRFSSLYSFKYSPRPGTAAARLPDDVPEAVKDERLARVMASQEGITSEWLGRYVGAEVEVLVEGPSRKTEGATTPGTALGTTLFGPPQLAGRTRFNITAHFPVSAHELGATPPGTLVRARVERALPHSLGTRLVASGASTCA